MPFKAVTQENLEMWKDDILNYMILSGDVCKPTVPKLHSSEAWFDQVLFDQIHLQNQNML